MLNIPTYTEYVKEFYIEPQSECLDIRRVRSSTN